MADTIISIGGVAPTVFTYAHLLKAYSLQGNVEEAGKAFTEMREAGIRPNIVCVPSSISIMIKYHYQWWTSNLNLI